MPNVARMVIKEAAKAGGGVGVGGEVEGRRIFRLNFHEHIQKLLDIMAYNISKRKEKV